MVDFVSNTTANSSVVIGYFIDIDLFHDLDEEDNLDDLQDKCRILTGEEYNIADGKVFIGLDLFDFDQDGSCKDKEYCLQDITQKIIEIKFIITNETDINIRELPEPSICGMTRSY